MEAGTVNPPFAVGDFVIAYGAGPEGYAHNGKVAEIVNIREEGGAFSGRFLHVNTMILMDFSIAKRIVTPEERSQLSTYLTNMLAITRADCDSYQRRYKTAQADYETLVRDFVTAMQTISDSIYEEADRRGYCDEGVEEFMLKTNKSLPARFPLEVKESEFEVETVITGTASITHIVRVKARSQEDADDEVRNAPDDHFDPEEILNEEYRLDWDNIEVEVQ